jgi:hypothetical protein
LKNLLLFFWFVLECAFCLSLGIVEYITRTKKFLSNPEQKATQLDISVLDFKIKHKAFFIKTASK